MRKMREAGVTEDRIKAKSGELSQSKKKQEETGEYTQKAAYILFMPVLHPFCAENRIRGKIARWKLEGVERHVARMVL